MGKIVFFIYLGILTVLDIRIRKLPVWILTAGGICMILYQLVEKEIPWEFCLSGAAVGGAFLMISKLTQKSFGYGDSFLILILGVGVGFWNLLFLLIIAFFLLGVVSVAALAGGKFQRKTGVPFVPFLWIGYSFIRILGI